MWRRSIALVILQVALISINGQPAKPYVWVNNHDHRLQLIQVLDKCSELGLEESDYPVKQIQLIDSLGPRAAGSDSLHAEMLISGAALHFFHDIAYGNKAPAIGYNGLDYTPNCLDIPGMMSGALAMHRLVPLVQQLEPVSAGYLSLKNMLNRFQLQTGSNGFKDVKVIAGKTDSSNQSLIARLYQLGIADSPQAKYSAVVMKSMIAVAERLFNFREDSTLHPSFITVLNVPLRKRIAGLKEAMNTMRWLRCMYADHSMIVLNIPSASLLVYEKENIILESKVIVGKSSTRTPTLTSKITDVVLWPYWMVPKKIATRELLPLIQKNMGYLDANAMQVLDQNGRVVNPGKINWNELSPSNFPYTLRQSTGCDNSLGILKLNFYSPYGVYLHDTPWKFLFKLNKRYQSHGCMRVDKAIELARIVLKEKREALDAQVEKGCPKNQSPVYLHVSEQMPVFVVYNTAWFDASGAVQLNEDIYHKMRSPK